MAKDIATARRESMVIGLGAVDVRRPDDLNKAAQKCAQELGGIDIVMYVQSLCPLILGELIGSLCHPRG